MPLLTASAQVGLSSPARVDVLGVEQGADMVQRALQVRVGRRR